MLPELPWGLPISPHSRSHSDHDPSHIIIFLYRVQRESPVARRVAKGSPRIFSSQVRALVVDRDLPPEEPGAAEGVRSKQWKRFAVVS